MNTGANLLPPLCDEEMRRRVLHRDDDVIVFDKPAGLPVHRGTKTTDDLQAHFPVFCFDRAEPPRLAHRLDKDTSGCLVLARHAEAAAILGKLFLRHRVDKVYWAVVRGRPAQDDGRIEAPLAKRAAPGASRMMVCAEGQPAITDYRVLAVGREFAWLELRPRTGRTHQLRAHCAALGCPIVGDGLYGEGSGAPLHLHARTVGFTLRYGSGRRTEVAAPLPPHFAATFVAAGWGEEDPQMAQMGADVSSAPPTSRRA